MSGTRLLGLLALLLLLLLAPLQVGSGLLYKDINPIDINLRVREKSNGINVTWRSPNKNINRGCYRSNLQYHSHCDLDWQDFNDLRSFSFFLQLPAKGARRNHTFRLRMKYACLHFSWSAWTAEKRWGGGDDTARCVEDLSAEADIVICVIIIVIPAMFLLAFLAARKQLRRTFLPKVPDPKHVYEDLLKIDPSQLESTFKNPCVEGVTVTIETICNEEEEEDGGGEARDGEPGGAGHAGPAASNPVRTTPTEEHAPYVYW